MRIENISRVQRIYKPKSRVESGNDMEYGVEMELRRMDEGFHPYVQFQSLTYMIGVARIISLKTLVLVRRNKVLK